MLKTQPWDSVLAHPPELGGGLYAAVISVQGTRPHSLASESACQLSSKMRAVDAETSSNCGMCVSR